MYIERAPKSLDVILCGGHAFENKERIVRILDNLNTEAAFIGNILMPCHAGAPRHATWWAKQHEVDLMYYPAADDTWAARLMVNLDMLAACSPKRAVVLLVPGKFTTTQHMFAEADKRGFQVLPVEI